MSREEIAKEVDILVDKSEQKHELIWEKSIGDISPVLLEIADYILKRIAIAKEEGYKQATKDCIDKIEKEKKIAHLQGMKEAYRECENVPMDYFTHECLVKRIASCDKQLAEIESIN